ncbi:hypothetical protein BC828DRAFT_384172 [Blastocladiella britannica]|nr:hypothetical protein BC828DRAFT_384172 [Blastocladiella britannica]
MDLSSAEGHLPVLHWWMLSGLELRYSEAAMDGASDWGHVKVLEWWARSGLPVKYSEDAMLLASTYNRVDVLRWWHNSYFQLKYDRVACVVAATKRFQSKTLVWWRAFSAEPFPSDPIDAAIAVNNLYMVQWWLQRGNCEHWTCDENEMTEDMSALLRRYTDGMLTDDEDSDSDDDDDDDQEVEEEEHEEEAETEGGEVELIVVGHDTTDKGAMPLDEKLDEALAGVALAVEELEQ